MIIARAPVRIDFSGGGSDCPPYSDDFGGAVINATISRYVTVELVLDRRRSPVILRAPALLQEANVGSVQDLSYDGRLDLLKAAVKRLDPATGFRLTVRSTAPVGSGLGVSSAIVVAALAALDFVQGGHRTVEDIAQLAYQVERIDLGYAGGLQDQYAAAYGGLNYLTVRGRDVRVEPLPVDTALMRALMKDLLLVYTGVAHASPDIIGAIQRGLGSSSARTHGLMDRLKAAAETQRDAYLRGDIASFVDMMNESWAAFSQLHSDCTSASLQRLLNAARTAGASGAKCCGAGGGGCVVIYCGRDNCQVVGDSVVAHGGTVLSVDLEPRGVQAWQDTRGGADVTVPRGDAAAGHGSQARSPLGAPDGRMDADPFGYVLRIAHRYCRNHDEASDMASEALLRLYVAISAGRTILDPAPYTAGIVRKLVADRERAKRSPSYRLTHPELMGDGRTIEEGLEDVRVLRPEVALLAKERSAILQAAVAGLGQGEREAIVMVYLHNVSTDDAAQALGLSRDALGKRLRRARSHLAKSLTGLER